MAYSRDGVLRGQTVRLRTVFEDDTGTLVDPASLPELYIYDESYTTEDIEAEIEAEVYTGLGPYTATRISTGYYEYAYSVPAGSSEGTWRDLWLATLGSVTSAEYFEFEVVAGAVVSLQRISSNTLIVIELDASIASSTGLTLEDDTQLAFSVTYDPLYASADLVRMEVGPWIDFIPDDTLNLLIHWASKEVDVITPSTWKKLHSTGYEDNTVYHDERSGQNVSMYRFARTKFVIYDVAYRALMLPASANAGNVSGTGGTKRLGDLLIEEGLGGMSGEGLTLEMVKEIKRLRDEWWRVVNAGGNIVPGQSLDPAIAVKGLNDPDRRKAGRLWEDNKDFPYAQPTVNSKYRRPGRRRHRFVFGGR